MARHLFGTSGPDWTFSLGVGNAVIAASAVLTFWNAETGGTQYTDLQDLTGNAITSVTSSSGLDGRTVGTVPPFRGPDLVWAMWAQAGASGPRILLTAVDIGDFVQQVADLAASTSSGLANHTSATNPHNTATRDLADVSTVAPTAGQILAYDLASGKYIPVNIPGLSGVVDLSSAQTITGTKTFDTGNINTTRIVIQASATGQVADTVSAWSGTDTGQGGARQRTFYLNEKGELRCIAARTNSVGVRFKGQPGQTANIQEWTDTSNVAMSWVTPNGSGRFPNSGIMVPWSQDGNVTAGTGKHGMRNITGVDLQIRTVAIQVNTAPTGTTPILVDFLLNGVSIFSNPSARPTIAAGATESSVVQVGGVTWPAGQTLRPQIVTVGSTTPGVDLAAQLLAY